MAYQIYRGRDPGDRAFVVGSDPALENELGRWLSDAGGDEFTGPMFSIKRDNGPSMRPYTFHGEDMDSGPLVR